MMLASRPGTRAAPAPMAPGTVVVSAQAGAETEVLWVVSTRDLLSCRTAGLVLRRVQRARPRHPLTLVAIGADSAWARSFLREERVRARVRTLSEREYHDTFGRSPTPMIYVLRSGRVHAVISPEREVSAGTQTIAALVNALDAHPAPHPAE